MKTIITRAGKGTKLVFTGDIFQIDHPYLNSYSNGLSYLIEKMKGQNIYAHINLEKGERSELADLASNIALRTQEWINNQVISQGVQLPGLKMMCFRLQPEGQTHFLYAAQNRY